MTIHVTRIPLTIELAAPSFTLGTVNTAGAATTAISSNSTLLTFDTTVPTDVSVLAVSAATGSVALPSRRDHVHGSSAVAFQSAASVAEMEAGSSNTVVVTPGRTQNHPGVAKVFCRIAAAGTLGSDSYNVDAITDTGTGDYLINFVTEFDDDTFSSAGIDANADSNRIVNHSGYATDSLRVTTWDVDGSGLADTPTANVMFGDQ